MCLSASFVPPRRTASNLHLIQRGISSNVTRVLATIERHIMTETHAARPARTPPEMGAALLPPVPASRRSLPSHSPSAALCCALLCPARAALLCPARAALLDLCASGSLSAPLLCAACAALRCSAVSSFALRSALCALCFSALSLCALSLYSALSLRALSILCPCCAQVEAGVQVLEQAGDQQAGEYHEPPDSSGRVVIR